MINKSLYQCAAVALMSGMSLYASSAFAGADTFNRPKLGGTWVASAGKLSISNDHLVGTTEALGYQKSSTGNSAVSAVIATGGTDLEYGAVTLGSIASGTNAFVKIQSQDGLGSFDHGGFYSGNNVGGSFFTLSSPVPSPAVLDVAFCGTVATMRITSAAGVQTYTFDYGSAPGNGAGAGTYGAVGIDNFIGFSGGCSAAKHPPEGVIVVRGSNARDKSLGQ